MKIKTIELDDDSLPTEVTVKMTIREAAAICILTGKMSPAAWEQIAPQLRYEDTEGIYESMHNLFCRFYEGAVDDFTETTPHLKLRIEDSDVR